MKRLIILLVWALLGCLPVNAQSPTGLWFLNINGGQTTVGVNNPLPGGFKIQAFGTPISVTTSNSAGTLPTGSPIVIATNVGSNTAYCAIGASATTSSQYIPSGGSFPFIVIGATQLTCITSTSTTTVNMTAGYGNAGSGGGGSSGGGGGGGGSVTQGTVPWVVSGQGTAGSAATGIVTVQGIASMTPLLSTLSAETTKVIGTVNQGTSPWVANVTQLGSAAINLGAGATGTGTLRITQASDSPEIAVLGAQADAICATATGTCSLTALIKYLNTAAGTALPAQSTQLINIGNVGGIVNVAPTNCSGTITTGGTAQNAFTAQTGLHGFTIMNIDTSAGSGEPLWMSFTTTAAASTAGSYALPAPTATTFASPGTWTSPIGFGTNGAVSIIGATTGHKFTCTWW